MSTKFTTEELQSINKADDLKISPFREDGKTYGTPTWIWEVVVDNNLYVRAYNGKKGRWYQSAIQQKGGCIHAAGNVREVTFEAVENDETLNVKIDEAYKAKYNHSPYLSSMISDRAKEATVRIIPKVSEN